MKLQPREVDTAGSPELFHLRAIVLHGMSAGLAFLVLTMLGLRRTQALAAVALFLFHPLVAEVVYWISCLSDQLMLVGFLAALAGVLGARRASGGRRALLLSAATVCTALALLSKETAVVIAPVLTLEALNAERSAWRRRLLDVLPLWGVTLGFLALRAVVVGSAGLGELYPDLGWSVSRAGYALLMDARLLLFPYPLTPFHGFPRAAVPVLLPSGLAMLALLGITGLWLRKRPRWLFWAGWIVIPLLPRLIQLFSTRWTGTIVAERYLLQSLVPWCAMIVLVSNSALKQVPTAKLRGRLGAILLISACLAGGSLAHLHGRVFASDATLFNHAIHHVPDDPVVLNSLAQLHMVKGENAEALPLLRRAIDSEPGLVPAHLNLGIVLSRMNRRYEAIPSFEAALQLDPTVAGANLLLGDSLRDVGKIDEAARHYRAELQLQPRSVAARTNLGSYRYVKGDLTGALRYWEDALADAPENSDLLFNLGMVCRELSEADRSARFLRRFLTVADERYSAQREMATRWLAE